MSHTNQEDLFGHQTHYHNTLYASGAKLAEYEAQASKQDALVLEFMAHNRQYNFTAEQISKLVMPNAPLTSARRALSNLFNAGRVKKVDQIDGQYNRPIIVWQYVSFDTQSE